jgi:hypothetical protein
MGKNWRTVREMKHKMEDKCQKGKKNKERGSGENGGKVRDYVKQGKMKGKGEQHKGKDKR